ncbi:MAG: DUF4845 domain-containing protein [Nitrosomonadales bacterium]|nr:DUF4845 domain-containing protein [Nitrosomonadales bacterium]
MTMSRRQRGISLSGLMVGVVILAFVFIMGLKIIPVYMQDAEIKNLFVAIATDPEMQKASPLEIRQSYGKRASIDNITAISMDDIDISREQDRLVLSASYDVKIPLVSNLSLYMEFEPSSASQ